MSQTRPRPRPRLVSRQTTGNDKAQVANVTPIDEDDLFRRNKGRTAQQWRQLEQSAAKAIPFTFSDDEWEPAATDESFPKPRKKKKKPMKQNDRPRWQATDVATMLSSDNEDSDIQIIEHTSTNTCANPSPNKRKREGSRFKSITPPPELPPHQRANAMDIVRQALAVPPRAPSPILDSPTDIIDLDPELAKIAEAAKQRAKHAHTDPQPAGGPGTVNIKVRWRPHPRDPSAQEQCWTFQIKRHNTFRELFDEVADLAGVMVDQLVINYDNKRVFASGTPHSLHIWAEGELEACDKHTAEYIRLRRINLAPSPSRPLDSSPGSSPPTAPQSDAESEPESTGGDTIKLMLRSTATKEKTFPLTVRSTTTCGAIVTAFLKAAGLPDTYSQVASTSRGKHSVSFPQLIVDGDKMASEAEIGDTDLEDGDLVEIVGI